jgi:hypothetical protein
MAFARMVRPDWEQATQSGKFGKFVTEAKAQVTPYAFYASIGLGEIVSIPEINGFHHATNAGLLAHTKVVEDEQRNLDGFG